MHASSSCPLTPNPLRAWCLARVPQFKSFTRQVEEAQVDVFRSLAPAQQQPSAGCSSFFQQALLHWRELSAAVDFNEVHSEVAPLVASLAQLVFHRHRIVHALLARLSMRALLSLPPLLRCPTLSSPPFSSPPPLRCFHFTPCVCTCHGLSRATASHVPRPLTCHGLSRATASHVPRPLTCHGLSRATASHVPRPLMCHCLSRATASHVPRPLTCHCLSRATASHVPRPLTCHGLSRATASHVPRPLTCHGLSRATASHVPRPLTCHGLSRATASHVPLPLTCHCLSRATASHVVECVAQMGKHLRHYLTPDIVTLLKMTKALRFYPADYVRELVAHSLAFVLRTAPPKQMARGVRWVLAEARAVACEERESGVALLLANAAKGPAHSLHSKAAPLLLRLLLLPSSLRPPALLLLQGQRGEPIAWVGGWVRRQVRWGDVCCAVGRMGVLCCGANGCVVLWGEWVCCAVGRMGVLCCGANGCVAVGRMGVLCCGANGCVVLWGEWVCCCGRWGSAGAADVALTVVTRVIRLLAAHLTPATAGPLLSLLLTTASQAVQGGRDGGKGGAGGEDEGKGEEQGDGEEGEEGGEGKEGGVSGGGGRWEEARRIADVVHLLNAALQHRRGMLVTHLSPFVSLSLSLASHPLLLASLRSSSSPSLPLPAPPRCSQQQQENGEGETGEGVGGAAGTAGDAGEGEDAGREGDKVQHEVVREVMLLLLGHAVVPAPAGTAATPRAAPPAAPHHAVTTLYLTPHPLMRDSHIPVLMLFARAVTSPHPSAIDAFRTLLHGRDEAIAHATTPRLAPHCAPPHLAQPLPWPVPRQLCAPAPLPPSLQFLPPLPCSALNRLAASHPAPVLLIFLELAEKLPDCLAGSTLQQGSTSLESQSEKGGKGQEEADGEHAGKGRVRKRRKRQQGEEGSEGSLGRAVAAVPRPPVAAFMDSHQSRQQQQEASEAWEGVLAAALETHSVLLSSHSAANLPCHLPLYLSAARHHCRSLPILSAVALFLQAFPRAQVGDTSASLPAFPPDLSANHMPAMLEALQDNFCHPAREMRVFHQVEELESAPYDLQMGRHAATALAALAAHATSARLPNQLLPAVSRCVLGLLHSKFAMMWQPAIGCLAALLSAHPSSTWLVVWRELRHLQGSFLLAAAGAPAESGGGAQGEGQGEEGEDGGGEEGGEHEDGEDGSGSGAGDYWGT
ncbi:unnamed protein product [Closterium sp. NIES-65]|nr:unnamed protein product [Closterium sp. NIES-65]